LKSLAAAIAKMGLKPMLEEQYHEAEVAQKRLLRDKAAILGEKDEIPVLPSMKELKRLAREATDLGFDDPGFCLAMHDLIPRITAFPYRLRDGGKIVFRAVMEIDLAPLAGESECYLGRQLVRSATVDLFDPPRGPPIWTVSSPCGKAANPNVGWPRSWASRLQQHSVLQPSFE
jgi:hypothetical protein